MWKIVLRWREAYPTFETLPSKYRVEHTQRFDEAFLTRAPLTQFLESDKAVMVRIDFLHHQSKTRPAIRIAIFCF